MLFMLIKKITVQYMSIINYFTLNCMIVKDQYSFSKKVIINSKQY